MTKQCETVHGLSFLYRLYWAGQGTRWIQADVWTVWVKLSQRTSSPLLSALSSTASTALLSTSIVRVRSSSETPGDRGDHTCSPSFLSTPMCAHAYNKAEQTDVQICTLYYTASHLCPYYCTPLSCRYVLYIHLVINDMIMLTVSTTLQILTYAIPLNFLPCCIMLLITMTTNK